MGAPIGPPGNDEQAVYRLWITDVDKERQLRERDNNRLRIRAERASASCFSFLGISLLLGEDARALCTSCG